MPRFSSVLAALSLCLLACQPMALPGPARQAQILRGAPLQAQALLRRQSALPVSGASGMVQAPSGGTLSGSFRLHSQVRSKHLQHARDVLIWLPPGYERNPQQRYPVLYMHDGNNLFDRRTSFGGSEWQVDERAGQMVASGEIEPVIIVGIYNTPGRMEEYTWYPMDLDGQMAGGQGASYARFLAEELKPLIDKTYRTQADREHTAVMGSSLGGLISFYIGMSYPQVFGKIGMMSPSVWWKDRAVLADVPRLPTNLKVWLDMGTAEGSNPEQMLLDARNLSQALEKRGFEHFRNLAFHVEPGATHSEQAWAARIDRPLRFFFGK